MKVSTILEPMEKDILHSNISLIAIKLKITHNHTKRNQDLNKRKMKKEVK